MAEKFKSEIITLPGTYGTRKVKLSRLFPSAPHGVHVLLLHGVHSSANLRPHNKFRCLACLLAERGFTPWLCETSRRIANIEAYNDDIDLWIKDAFEGKTFQNEFDDCITGLRYVESQSPRSLWIWGFSLGGITALALACLAERKIDKIIMSGTGMGVTTDTAQSMLSLPILSTLLSTLDTDLLNKVKTDEVVSFRGTDDIVFSEQACRDLLAAINIPPEKKRFYIIAGADHSMRMRRGIYDKRIMREMLSLLIGE